MRPMDEQNFPGSMVQEKEVTLGPEIKEFVKFKKVDRQGVLVTALTICTSPPRTLVKMSSSDEKRLCLKSTPSLDSSNSM